LPSSPLSPRAFGSGVCRRVGRGGAAPLWVRVARRAHVGDQKASIARCEPRGAARGPHFGRGQHRYQSRTETTVSARPLPVLSSSGAVLLAERAADLAELHLWIAERDIPATLEVEVVAQDGGLLADIH
jgi:hypothetical protein